MSAFHIRIPTREYGSIKLDLAFQGSKVFERGGPFIDLYRTSDGETGAAKRDPRLRESGALVGFRFEGLEFPLEPKTAFYDWLCCSFLFGYREWAEKLHISKGFTDIEFNPVRSINCQARSAALFLSLMKRGQLENTMRSRVAFLETLNTSAYRPRLRSKSTTGEPLFAAV